MRVYTVEFHAVSVSAVQDLLSVTTGTKAVKIHQISLGQVTATTIQNLNISLKYLSGTLTSGSGGAAVTPHPLNPGDAAATATARANDTTQASGTTSVNIFSDVFNIINGYIFQPAPEDRPIAAPSTEFVVSLNTAPGTAITVSGFVVFEELF